MPKKLTYKYIQERFDKEGYTLIAKSYKNNSQPLEYLCPVGHKHYITWRKFQQGHRCGQCAGNIKIGKEKVTESFADEGLKVLDFDYINSRTKIPYVCAECGEKHRFLGIIFKRGADARTV